MGMIFNPSCQLRSSKGQMDAKIVRCGNPLVTTTRCSLLLRFTRCGSHIWVHPANDAIAVSNPLWSIRSMDKMTAHARANEPSGHLTTETCDTAERIAPTIPVDGGACGPDGVSIVRKHTFRERAVTWIHSSQNGPNCLVSKVNGKVPDDHIVSVLINSRCFSYYNISSIGDSEFFRKTVQTALTNVRSYVSATGTQKAPAPDIGAYLKSYSSGAIPSERWFLLWPPRDRARGPCFRSLSCTRVPPLSVSSSTPVSTEPNSSLETPITCPDWKVTANRRLRINHSFHPSP